MLKLNYIGGRFAKSLTTLVLSMFAFSTFGQGVTLGELDFPTSGAPEAQQEFDRGMLYMHSFEYDPAAVAFRKAQAIDPEFAMAYWGEAMTNHHSLWRVQHQQAAQDILNKLGKTSKERVAKAPTQREKDFIHAAEILFGMTEETQGLDKLERDVHYRNAMKRVLMSYPDDLEVRALYGLSILGVGSANREYATYMHAAAVITPVWDANHSHPGAAHYLIHSYDDPVHAILGLPMARAYEKIAVDAAHAQHMTSHIYVALGLWDDMTGANVTALSVESAKTVGEGSRSREAWHHRYWLHYGRLQQGRLDEAREMLTMARNRIGDGPLPREPSYYGAMYARYLVDTESWEEADNWLAPDDVHVPTPHYYFAQAYAAAQLGHLDKARDLLPKIQMGGKEANPEIILSQEEVDILKLEVESVIAMKEGNAEKAVTMAREAAAMQASLPFRYGPPRISKPTAELLGDISYELGDDAGAILAYQDQLSRSKLRTNSLIGLARATARIGDDATSQEAYGSLANIWHSADESVTALAEVKRLTRRN
jgi:tetratricopeptide (TPR) repeat protein